MVRRRPRLRPLLVLAPLLVACDGYVEELIVSESGEVEHRIVTSFDCSEDPGLVLEPCELVDMLEDGRAPDGFTLPLDFELTATGDRERRVEARWASPPDEVETPTVESATINELGDQRTEIILRLFEGVSPLLALGDGAVGSPSGSRNSELRVIVPGRVVEHDGDRIEGRTVIYDLGGDREAHTIVWTNEDRGLPVWWWLVGVGILSAVLLMIVSLERPPPRTEPD